MTTGPSQPALAETLPALLGDRPLRIYPAVLSAEADAMSWARPGAQAGSVVTADYQAAPRGRGGFEWQLRPEVDVAFSLVLRPDLPEAREGWLYSVATTALTDAYEGCAIRWPDEVHLGERVRARVGVQTGVTAQMIDWAVVSVLLRGVERAPAVATAVAAIEHRLADDPAEVLATHQHRLGTLGRIVRARMIPMGPSGVVHEGEAEAVREDGGLAIRTAAGALVRIVPQAVGTIEEVSAGGQE